MRSPRYLDYAIYYSIYCVKIKTFTMNYKNRYPWITEALRKKIKCKNQLHAIAVSSHDGNIMKYKEAQKVHHSALRNSVTS